ncbi:MAG TPA: hypothetical protein VGO96_01805 [Pyrinomonadaceae bacterium]|jgi:hypothetical protein|nr:hypothetical protein [Pyrinomonadaceae bacterium]
MQRRQITLEDGRYLIFYTFDEEIGAASSSSSTSDAAAGTARSPARVEEPEAEPQATEERRV